MNYAKYGRRAAHVPAFQVEMARKKAVVDAILERDGGTCTVCPRKGYYVKWRNPSVIEVDGGHLTCAIHFTPNVVRT